jgi:hypothetical protein
MIDIASGEVEDMVPAKNTKVQAGALGGKKRAGRITSKRRSEIASSAAKKRWAKLSKV